MEGGHSHQSGLPVLRVGEIPLEPTPRRWLIEGLWGAAAVGFIGGPPKCCKSYLGLDMAFSVATGTPC
ncbi:MAG: AAA family ATPase, partial [Gemmatimonadales bacterium]|nr:AAA family ATPase [Gemmatimonadales bacterium]